MRILTILFLLACFPAWGADANGYTALYECKSGGTKCNVDVTTLVAQACDQTITTATTPTGDWSAINFSNNVICIQNGDHSGRGVLTITADGTSGTRKVLRYTRASDDGDKPWNQSAANKAKMRGIILDSANYWVIHRLTIDGDGNASPTFNGLEFLEPGNSDNNIIDSVLIEDGTYNMVTIGAGNDNNTIQNSVIRDCTPTLNQDFNGIGSFGGPDFNHFVNNEIYGCTHAFYISEHVAEGTIIENNDMYVPTSLYADCNGNLNSAGPCSRSEDLIGLKGGGTATNPNQFLHNRLWGPRKTDLTAGSPGYLAGADGFLLVLTNDGDPGPAGGGAKYTLIQNNIAFDAQLGLGDYWPNVGNNSIIGNIVYKIKPYVVYLSYAFSTNYNSSSEWYLNTVIDVDDWFSFGGATPSDIRCNVMIDSGFGGDFTGSQDQVDYNVFYNSTSFAKPAPGTSVQKTPVTRVNSTAYTAGAIMRTTATPPADGTAGDFLWIALNTGISAGSSPTFCTRLNCQTKDNNIWWKAIRGSLVWKRKLLTVSGGETFYIPYARAKNDSDLPEYNHCPSNFADRAGTGINDATGFSSFSPDIRGVAR